MSEVVARIDDFGRPAWIALMVIGFIVFWPVGLAILATLGMALVRSTGACRASDRAA